MIGVNDKQERTTNLAASVPLGLTLSVFPCLCVITAEMLIEFLMQSDAAEFDLRYR
jgi:hypothetical protein